MSAGKKVSLRKKQVTELSQYAPGADNFYFPAVPVQVARKVDGKIELVENVAMVSLFTGIPVSMMALFPISSLLSLLSGAAMVAIFALQMRFSFFSSRSNQLKQAIFERNLEAFIYWLKARYGIVYDPTEDDQKWLNGLVSYGRFALYKGEPERRTFSDVNGRQFCLQYDWAGSLYVAEDTVSTKEMKTVVVIHESNFSDSLPQEGLELFERVESKLTMVADWEMDTVSEHVVSRVKSDLNDLSKTVYALKRLGSVESESSMVVSVLAGLDNDLQNIIDSRTKDLKRELAGQVEWVQSRQTSEQISGFGLKL